MSRREITLYVDDIRIAIGKIIDYTKDVSYKEFSQDAKTIDAVVRNLEIIGEAVKRFPSEIHLQYPQVPWKKIGAMRDKVIHEYFGIDVEIIWQTVKEDIPELNRQIDKVYKKIKKEKHE